MESKKIKDNPFENMTPEQMDEIVRPEHPRLFTDEELKFIIKNDAKQLGVSAEEYKRQVMSFFIYGKFWIDAIMQGYYASPKGMMKYFNEKFQSGQQAAKKTK